MNRLPESETQRKPVGFNAYDRPTAPRAVPRPVGAERPRERPRRPTRSHPRSPYMSDYEDAKYEDPRYEDPRYEDPRYEDPRYEDPRYEDPKYEDPRYEDRRYEDAKYKNRRYEDAKYKDAKYEDAKYKDARYEDAKYKDARYEDAKYEDARYEDAKYEDEKGKRLGNKVSISNVTTQHAGLATTISDVASALKYPPPYETIAAATQDLTTLAVETLTEKAPSFLKNAVEEAIYFAGGLVPHPHESTKHYSILRHSPSIIFYRGPATTVVVTVFSSTEPDTPLPADRTIWLQQRGFSGDTGMKLKRLVGATETLLDVTPTTLVREQHVTHADERSWKRDIAKFMKKYSEKKTGRAPRETLVIQLPTLVEDGYFRLVLCTGGKDGSQDSISSRKRKFLCSSPVFRVASTSTTVDPSVFKGASLMTMPLELGVMVGSQMGLGKLTAALPPATDKMQSRGQDLQADTDRQRQIAMTAYEVSGRQEKVNAAEAQYMQTRDAAFEGFGKLDEGSNIDLDVVGSDDGPDSPYPLKFVGYVVPGSGGRKNIPGVPTANLAGVNDDTKRRVRGTYLGWACIVPDKDGPGGPAREWYEAIIRAGPSRDGAATAVAKDCITVHLIHDFGSYKFFNSKLEVIVMWFLRPAGSVSSTTPTGPMYAAVARDIRVTLSSLSRANWGPQVALQNMGDARTFSEKGVHARQQRQRRADSPPLLLTGVRAPSAEVKDQTTGNGGYWIPRAGIHQQLDGVLR